MCLSCVVFGFGAEVSSVAGALVDPCARISLARSCSLGRQTSDMLDIQKGACLALAADCFEWQAWPKKGLKPQLPAGTGSVSRAFTRNRRVALHKSKAASYSEVFHDIPFSILVIDVSSWNAKMSSFPLFA